MGYEHEQHRERELRFAAWGQALTIRDLCKLLPEPIPVAGQALFTSWDTGFAILDATGDDADPAARRQTADQLTDETEALRGTILEVVRELD